jgi:hypothetical protein
MAVLPSKSASAHLALFILGIWLVFILAVMQGCLVLVAL